jgi:hypothetical protein
MNKILRNYINDIEKYRYYSIFPIPDLPLILMLETGIAALSPNLNIRMVHRQNMLIPPHGQCYKLLADPVH